MFHTLIILSIITITWLRLKQKRSVSIAANIGSNVRLYSNNSSSTMIEKVVVSTVSIMWIVHLFNEVL
jgi:hypothetical protein